MSSAIDRALTTVLTLSALAIAVGVVRNAFSAPPADGVRVPDRIRSWERAIPIGHVVAGDSASPLTVVTLMDFECPACAGFHQTLKQFTAAHPGAVRAVYVHHPLGYHRFALAAARGAECAARAGKFEAWADAIYAKRDSLGVRSWGAYARDAGIADTNQVVACVNDQAPVQRIQEGQAFGESIHLEGTPTVLINGWRFHRTPTLAILDSAFRAAGGQ